jgi:hypothetical protein
MRGPIFKQHERRIRRSITASEEIEDIETLYSIIVRAREGVSGTLRNEEVALISLCFIAWPGKGPSYTEDVVQFRRAFRGIAGSIPLQQDFESRLSYEFLNAVSPEELKFDDISQIFNVGGLGLDWSTGAGGHQGTPAGVSGDKTHEKELQTH